jgi:hypothetical protein
VAHKNIRLISLSYFLDSFVLFVFVFWFYLYLTDERGFSVLKGRVVQQPALRLRAGDAAVIGEVVRCAGVAHQPQPRPTVFAIGAMLSAALCLCLGAAVSAPAAGDSVSVACGRVFDEYRGAILVERRQRPPAPIPARQVA